MKKLMIVLAAVAYTTVSQAASVSWYLEKDTDKTFGNLTAYVINGANFDAVKALLTAGGETVATDFNTYVIDTVALNSRGAGSSNTSDVTGSTLAWIIFADNQIKDGSTYSTTGAIDVSTYSYTPPDSAPGDLALTVASFTTRGAPIGDVPEPTSGVLMLLGLAGLALKRKRA